MGQFNAKSSYQSIRNKCDIKFFKYRLERIKNGDPLTNIYTKIMYVFHMFPRVCLLVKEAKDITVFNVNPPQTVFAITPEAIALFIAEIIIARGDWDIMCGEWRVCRQFYGFNT